jgi:hypothetical protein
MTRFEMKRKRAFLSEKGRWVISVWNKGKVVGKRRTVRDGGRPAWEVFHNGKEQTIPPLADSPVGIEIGIVDVGKA